MRAQPADTSVVRQSLFDLVYQDTAILRIELEADHKLIRKSRRDTAYQKGVLRWGAAFDEELPVKLRVRGRLRRRICDVPPLKLRFSKKRLRARRLAPYNDHKLVTHCMYDGNSGDAVVREYLAYRLYQLLTPVSFRVQLVQIHYRQADKKRKNRFRYGILIEDVEQLTDRLNGREVPRVMCTPEMSCRTQEDLMSVFQMCIGNHDYTVGGGHNVKWFEVPGEKGLLPVPYDFDFSGLVMATYATPLPNYRQLEKVTDRLYLGRAQSDEALSQAIELLVQKREALLAEVERCPGLSDYSREQIGTYLEAFFDRVNVQDLAAGKVYRY